MFKVLGHRGIIEPFLLRFSMQINKIVYHSIDGVASLFSAFTPRLHYVHRRWSSLMEQDETAQADETGLAEDDNIDLPDTHDKETMTKLTSTPGTSHRSTTNSAVDHVQDAGTGTGDDQHNTSDCRPKSCIHTCRDHSHTHTRAYIHRRTHTRTLAYIFGIDRKHKVGIFYHSDWHRL